MNGLQKSLLILLFIFSISCTKQLERENTALLKNVAAMLNQNEANEALRLLTTVNTGELSEYNYNYYTLLQVRASDIANRNILPFDTIVEQIKDYFREINDAPKTAMAYFYLARICEQQGNYLKSIAHYIQADEWAEKAEKPITEFSHFRALYNLAVLYAYDKKYEESNKYLDKAFILNDCNEYKNKLYSLELKATNSKYNRKSDESLKLYSEALDFAYKNNDNESVNRIIHNKGLFLMEKGEYREAINTLHRILQSENEIDEKDLGNVYIALSNIYRKNNQPDSALICIETAQTLIEDQDYYYSIPMYKCFYQAENDLGNNQKSKYYEEKYYQLKNEQDKQRYWQQKELEKFKKYEQLQADINLEKHELIKLHRQYAQQQRQSKLNLMLLVVFLIGCSVAVVAVYRRRVHAENEVIEMRLQNKENLFRNLKQYYSLLELGNWVDENLADEKGKELSKIINNMVPSDNWALSPKFYDKNYKRMFDNFKQDFPYLAELEYEILCLICTNLYNNRDEMAAVLSVSPDDFKAAEISMKAKLSVHGYNFDKLMYRSRIAYNINHMNGYLFKPSRLYQLWCYKITRFFEKLKRH